MYEDDIDWLNASSDCGLISLCRELAQLARPLEIVAAAARRSRQGAAPRVKQTQTTVPARAARLRST